MTEEGIICCDTLTCDPVRNYASNAHCGNCPLVLLYYEFLECDVARIVFEPASLPFEDETEESMP